MGRIASAKKAVVAFVGSLLQMANVLLPVVPPAAQGVVASVIGVLTFVGVYLARNEVDAIVENADKLVDEL